ncbi:MAG TPA: hypothetical protein VGJ86_19715 [Acidimicrobiales bacterium]
MWWLPFAFGVAGLFQVADATTAAAFDKAFDNGFDLQGTVDPDYGGGESVGLRYDNPLTGETEAKAVLWGAVSPPEPGAQVAIEVDRADPRDVVLAGDRYPADYLWWYSSGLVAFVVAFGLRLFGVWRVERLMRSRGPSFAMLAAIRSRRRTGRVQLHLYALDAAAGTPPLCSVALLTSHGLPLDGDAFVVEVKGKPRPFGRVVAKVGETVLWPRGRSLSAASTMSLPAAVSEPSALEPTDPPAGNIQFSFLRRTRLQLAAVVASVGIGCLVTLLVFQGRHDANDLAHNGVEVITTVTGANPDDDSVDVRFRLPGEETRQTAQVPVHYPEDWDKGDRFPAMVDPTNPDRIRFLEEPYDAVLPLMWGWALAGMVALPWLVWSLRWRRLERRAVTGPWFEVDTWIVGRNIVPALADEVLEVAIARPNAATPSCVVRLPVDWSVWWPHTGIVRMAASGTIAPREAVALRHGDDVVPALGPARSPAGRTTPGLGGVDHSAIELRRFVSVRKPRIELRPGYLDIHLDTYFGSRPWTIPTESIGLIDLTNPRSGTGLTGRSDILVPATNPLARPTLLLLFREPQTVPPLRWTHILGRHTGVDVRESRAGKARVDGVLLQVVDAPSAAARLEAVGVERVAAPGT